jgi:hypothetical protein
MKTLKSNLGGVYALTKCDNERELLGSTGKEGGNI